MSRRRDLDERERRLDALREEALDGAPGGAGPGGGRGGGEVSGEGVRPQGAPFPQAPFPTASAENGYYGLPLLKEPQWTWEVPLYFFVGGAAGAAAVVGAASRLAGGVKPAAAANAEAGRANAGDGKAGDGKAGAELARDARWIATGGAALSGFLLVADLGRPERFLNMLRVFKPQSPMSVGAWTLTAFSSAAAAATFADLVRRRYGASLPVRVLQDAGDALAAATGLVMASYTGVLIGATVVPVWNRSVHVLPIHFAASGLASAVGLLELAGHRDRALNRLGLAAAAVEVGTGAWHELRDVRELAPLEEGRSGLVVRSGGVLSGPVALVLRLLGRRRAAAVAALAGSLLTRYGWMEAGKASARDPELPLRPAAQRRGAAGGRLY